MTESLRELPESWPMRCPILLTKAYYSRSSIIIVLSHLTPSMNANFGIATASHFQGDKINIASRSVEFGVDYSVDLSAECDGKSGYGSDADSCGNSTKHIFIAIS